MGAACGVDKYKQIRELYGLELTKMVIGEKNRLFLDRIINKLRKEVSQYAKKAEENVFGHLKEKEGEIQGFYAKVKEELDQRQPGGVKSLQQMTNKTSQQLLGYDFIKELLKDFKQSISSRYKQEETLLLEELLQIKLAQQQLFNQQKPSLTLYNDMQADEREAVLKRGQMQFHDLVVKYQQRILNRYGHKLTLDYYSSRIDNIDASESLENLIFLAKDKFITSLNLILSQQINSYILIPQP